MEDFCTSHKASFEVIDVRKINRFDKRRQNDKHIKNKSIK